jgi:hypothetical protein
MPNTKFRIEEKEFSIDCQQNVYLCILNSLEEGMPAIYQKANIILKKYGNGNDEATIGHILSRLGLTYVESSNVLAKSPANYVQLDKIIQIQMH